MRKWWWMKWCGCFSHAALIQKYPDDIWQPGNIAIGLCLRRRMLSLKCRLLSGGDAPWSCRQIHTALCLKKVASSVLQMEVSSPSFKDIIFCQSSGIKLYYTNTQISRQILSDSSRLNNLLKWKQRCQTTPKFLAMTMNQTRWKCAETCPEIFGQEWYSHASGCFCNVLNLYRAPELYALVPATLGIEHPHTSQASFRQL